MATKSQEIENKELIEEMTKASAAPEPNSTIRDRIVHSGDDDVPSPMTVASVKSAGYTYIYDMETGQRSLTNNNMLAAQLKKTVNGKRVFTTVDPKIDKKSGTICCYLHPDNPNRAHYDEMGLPVCKKSNLINEFQRTRHMQKKHKDEWAAIEAEKKESESKVAQNLLEKLISKK